MWTHAGLTLLWVCVWEERETKGELVMSQHQLNEEFYTSFLREHV